MNYLPNENIQRTQLEELISERKGWYQYKNNIAFNDALNKIKGSNYNDSELEQLLMTLGPWKKGPFTLDEKNIEIDAEWKSNLKWQRIVSKIPSLENKTILDIGCNNGYFMFEMAKQNPKFVLGIDPVVQVQAQFQAINHFKNLSNLKMELLGVEHLNLFRECFDTVFSMGILYHHRNPINQLIEMKDALKPGGELIVETIGIPGEGSNCLFPEGRYAGMGNVWFLPTLECFKNWLLRAKFTDIEVISTNWGNENEQRATKWCNQSSSYIKSLDPANPAMTIEGLPRPERFCLYAKKKRSDNSSAHWK